MAAASAPPPAETPLDRALALAFAGEHEAALRRAAPVLRHDPASPKALFVTGRALGELGRREAAHRALRQAVTRAANRGHFALAVASAAELGRLGGDAAEALEAVAEAFCKGSRRLASHAPPPLPLPPAPDAPLADTLAGAALLEAAIGILGEAEPLLATLEAAPPLAAVPLISSIGREALRELCAAARPAFFAAGRTVIEHGAAGDEAYLVACGELEARRGDVVLASLPGGSLFGEMALLARAPRAAEVVAVRPSIVLQLARGALDGLAERQPEVGVELAAHCRERMIANLARTSPVLLVVPPADRPALLDRFQTRVFEARDRLIEQDALPPGLYLIASGGVTVVRRDPEGGDLALASLGPGDVVGEVALVLRRRASADVIAAHPTVSLFLPATDFLGLIHDHPAMLAELYLLAVRRDEETSHIVAEEAAPAEDFILV